MGQLDNNYLPPELVEKMKQVFEGNSAISYALVHVIGQECTQIAVDYANSISLDFQVHNEIEQNLRKQRDELIDNQFNWKYFNESPENKAEKVLIQWTDGSIGIWRFDSITDEQAEKGAVWCEIKKFEHPKNYINKKHEDGKG